METKGKSDTRKLTDGVSRKGKRYKIRWYWTLNEKPLLKFESRLVTLKHRMSDYKNLED